MITSRHFNVLQRHFHNCIKAQGFSMAKYNKNLSMKVHSRNYSISPLNSDAPTSELKHAFLPISTKNIVQEVSTILPWEYALEGSILWPSNLIERALECIHMSSGFGWGATIIFFTLGLRTLLLPLAIKQNRMSVLSNNLKPKTQKLQEDSQRLRELGQVKESRMKILELSSFMSKNNINPIKILGVSLFPLPLFMASFFAIRNMTLIPVESFCNQGLFWFSDLSVADPYYILPALSTTILLLTMEVSKHSTPSQSISPTMQLGLRIMALVSFPVLSFMPSALLLYFCTSNFMTLATSTLLAFKSCRRYLNIPDIIQSKQIHKPQSFMETFKESYRAYLRSIDGDEKILQRSKVPTKVFSQKPRHAM